MAVSHALLTGSALAPTVLMGLLALYAQVGQAPSQGLWRLFGRVSSLALVLAAVAALSGPSGWEIPAVLQATTLGLMLAVLVQLLGTVIGAFSARYLKGERGQRRYIAALAWVLSAVHLLLLADHWVVLIAAWALVGAALQPLLCFYPERPFARLAAHKKRVADRLADALLLLAAGLAWVEVGSGSLSALWSHLEQSGMSPALQASALALVLAVILRTALLPVHGWLIQVMEAPTPVSALLHAGVVNLGGFVLIRFAPLLEQATPARSLLLVVGLLTAVLAGMVMLTRISIKVRLAWSTVAQMGFMLMECALGLYTLAALHLIGHSLYKAHAFLSASDAVRQTRLQMLGGDARVAPWSLVVAPGVAVALVAAVLEVCGLWFVSPPWPVWWSALLALAWAPLLWLPAGATRAVQWRLGFAGALLVAGMTGAAIAVHALPLGLSDAPHHGLGWLALCGLGALYLCLCLLQWRAHWLSGWRRWSYAGFYVDEIYTRAALRLWPTLWAPAPQPVSPPAQRAGLTPEPR